MFKEFKEFAMRGNVVDMAVGGLQGVSTEEAQSAFDALNENPWTLPSSDEGGKRVLGNDQRSNGFRVFLPRAGEHEYSVTDGLDRFYILSNDGAENFQVLQASIDNPARSEWKPVIPNRDDVLIEGIDVFAGHVVISGMSRGASRLEVLDRSDNSLHTVAFEEDAFLAYTTDNFEYEGGSVRYVYESMTTPESVFDYDFEMNTFTDFIDVSKFLVREGYTSPGHLYARGGSAGGLLMGAIVNMAPDLYNGVTTRVPFVDVVTTMLDESIPLTASEWDEWGDPRDKTDYEYMLSYSPYDQVREQDYPNILVTTGLHDSQVQYWEPAKWVAKLRDMKTDDNLLILKTDMQAGHSGKTGRFQRLEDAALYYAFFLNLEGINE